MHWSSEDRVLVQRLPTPATDSQSSDNGAHALGDPDSNLPLRQPRPLEEQCIDDSGRLWVTPRAGVRVRVRLRIVRGNRLDPVHDQVLASHRRLPPRSTSRTRCRISADMVGFAAWAS